LRIKELTISGTKNLGDYNNIKLGFSFEINEGEDPASLIKLAQNYLYFHLNQAENNEKYKHLKSKGEPTAKDLRWIENYETTIEELNAQGLTTEIKIDSGD